MQQLAMTEGGWAISFTLEILPAKEAGPVVEPGCQTAGPLGNPRYS